jgi:GNAT superfamily N-acetyltransferase
MVYRQILVRLGWLKPQEPAITITHISCRAAIDADIEPLMALRDLSWREAYQGIIPHNALYKMLHGRQQGWWHASLKHNCLQVLTVNGTLAGYGAFGRNRHASLAYTGEIIELYLSPAYQGIGLGKYLFEDCQRHLHKARLKPFLVWSLADNHRACQFYQRQGGKLINESIEKFGSTALTKLAFGFDST